MSSLLHAQWFFSILFDSPLCTLHRLSHLPFHPPDLHLHLPCGLVRGEVHSASANEELGTLADNNPLTKNEDHVEEEYRSENFDCEILTPAMGELKQEQWSKIERE